MISKIAGLGLGLAGLVTTGCASSTGGELTLLSVRWGHQNAIYRETDDRYRTDREMFRRDVQPYNRSQFTNEAVPAIQNNPAYRREDEYVNLGMFDYSELQNPELDENGLISHYKKRRDDR